MDINSLLSPDSHPPATQSTTVTNPGMDTLADLAAMQHHQPHRPTAPSLLRSAESFEHQLSPSPMNPHSNQAVNHNTPTPRTSFDIAMSDGPQESAQRNYIKTSLAPEAQQKATILFNEISKNPHSYDAHVQFIHVLHAGFMNHVYPPDDPNMHGEPRAYDLLKDMRTAREEMDKLFAMGEDLWAEWLQDESMLASSLDECISVMELCKRSVAEEYGSTKLWIVYGEWVLHLYEAGPQRWTEPERAKAAEYFNLQTVLEVWQAAVEATQWRVHDSHLVWDRLCDLYVRQYGPSPGPKEVDYLRKLFQARLQIPHARWDNTFSKFKEFVEANLGVSASTQRLLTRAVHPGELFMKWYDLRHRFEERLSYAQGAQNTTMERQAWTDYIHYETRHQQRNKKFDKQLAFALQNSLYQRALLRFPVDVSLWQDHVAFLLDQTPDISGCSTLATLDRATRHCPWSGDLWSQYLLSFEREEQKTWSEIANIKHKATSTGLLDVGGIEEVLKVLAAWCGYLRRRAFLPNSLDEDMDVASVGIVSAKESLTELGIKLYGAAWQGDPHFRLERIHIRFLSESGSWDSAREIFKSLIEHRGTSYEFWIYYYQWEMSAWLKFIEVEATADVSRHTSNPSYATAVLKQASRRKDLDWPEKVMETYIDHCQDYEDTDELQQAFIITRRTMMAVNANRARAHEAATKAAAEAAMAANAVSQDDRKRAHSEDRNGEPDSKKARNDEKVSAAEVEPIEPAPEPQDPGPEPSRNREYATVLVENLPPDVTKTHIRKFFYDVNWSDVRDCLIFYPESGSDERATAVLEFYNHQGALSACTRDGKPLVAEYKHKDFVRVSQDTGLLWVSRFPDTFDEDSIRKLFSPYGTIVEVRLPSLAKNVHRRFGYVQFLRRKEAEAALELDGKMIEKHRLVVKISEPPSKDPQKKAEKLQIRTAKKEAIKIQSEIKEAEKKETDVREIFCKNLPYKLTNEELAEAFASFGKVELAWIALDIENKSLGWGKVRFSTKEEAVAALEKKDVMIGERPVICYVLKSGQNVTNVHNEHRGDGNHSNVHNEHQGDGIKNNASKETTSNGLKSEVDERTVAVLNVPDNVTRGRIAALFAKYGDIERAESLFQHGGAFVVFAKVADCGKARLALEGTENLGVTLRLGTVQELKRQGRGGVGTEPEKDFGRGYQASFRGDRGAGRGRGRGRARGHRVGIM